MYRPQKVRFFGLTFWGSPHYAGCFLWGHQMLKDIMYRIFYYEECFLKYLTCRTG